MEQVKDDLPYYPQCDSCVHGGNFQPYWHPYPQDRPIMWGSYLVSLYVGLGEDKTITRCLPYSDETWNQNGVIAWAELPQPYKGE